MAMVMVWVSVSVLVVVMVWISSVVMFSIISCVRVTDSFWTTHCSFIILSFIEFENIVERVVGQLLNLRSKDWFELRLVS